MDSLFYLHAFLSPTSKLRAHLANQVFPFHIPEHKNVAVSGAALSGTPIADICLKMIDSDTLIVLNEHLAIFQNSLCVANWCHKHDEILYYVMVASKDKFWIHGDKILYQEHSDRSYKGSKINGTWFLTRESLPYSVFKLKTGGVVMHIGVHTDEMCGCGSWQDGWRPCNCWANEEQNMDKIAKNDLYYHGMRLASVPYRSLPQRQNLFDYDYRFIQPNIEDVDD